MVNETINEVLEKIETEHGTFTEDKEKGLTAEEYYRLWLESQNNPLEPQAPEPNEIDNLKVLAQNVLELTSVVEAMLLGGIE